MAVKGKILGFNEGGGAGAISAEDGSRHRFVIADWRGDKPPVAGQVVDFESDKGVAREIYPVGGGGLSALGDINVDLSSLSASPGGARVAALFTRSLATPLATGVLLACFLPAISSPVAGYSLIGLGEAVAQIAAPAAMAARMAGEGGGGDLGTLEALLILRFAVPLSALWLIWTAWNGKSERLPTLGAGGAAILAAALPFLIKSAAVSAVPEVARSQAGSLINIGAGVWLLLLLGAALIAAGLGLIRNPLAKT